jgi:hypothetical protein
MATLGILPESNTYYTRISLAPYKRGDAFEIPKMETPTFVAHLPLPTELRDDTTVGYTNVNLETVGDFLDPNRSRAQEGGSALGAAASLRSIGSLGQLGLTASSRGLAGVTGGLGGLGTIAGAAGGGFLSVVQSLVPAEQITSAIQQKTGAAPNPNPSVQFQGPVLRDFALTWAFYPKNEIESGNISTLIKRLKGRALPSQNRGNSGAVLNYPHICQLNFFPWDGKGDPDDNGWTDNSIIKIKKCFMSGVNVNYNAFGTPAFFQGTQLPISYQLTINFKEIDYLLSDAWDESAAGERNVARVTADNVIEEGGRIIFGTARTVITDVFSVAKEAIFDSIEDQSTADKRDRANNAMEDLTAGDASSFVAISTPEFDTIDGLTSLAPGGVEPRTAGVWYVRKNSAGKYVVTFDPVDIAASNSGPAREVPAETKGTFDTQEEADAYLDGQSVFALGTQTQPPPPETAAPAPGQ